MPHFGGILSDKLIPTETRATKVSIKYPQKDEVIASKRYAFKISTSIRVDKVMISLDDGEWRLCREAGGYWWFDWEGYVSRTYLLQAVAQTNDGAQHLSPFRRFKVSCV